MSTIIPQRLLRNDNARVIEAVTAWETFVIARNGEPVAELRVGRQTCITRDAVAALAGAHIRIDRERFRSDVDAVIDPTL